MAEPNTTQPSLVELLGLEFTLELIADFIRCHYRSSPHHARRIEESIEQFIASHGPLVGQVASGKEFARHHPEAVRRLLSQAVPKLPQVERSRLLQLLQDIGCLDLAPTEAPKAVKVRIAPARQPTHYTPSQRRASQRLRDFARLHFKQPEFRGIRLRAQPLIVGPSGVGKTFLVQDLAHSLGLPLVKHTVGDWLPMGSKTDTPTLTALRQFVEKNEQGIVHLDELDKHSGGKESAWLVCVMAEVFTLLDRQPAAWKTEAVTKLRERFMIIGSGTWQDIWDLPSPSPIGFSGVHLSDEDADQRLMTRVRKARVIPPELLNRFNESWIILNPYTAADFSALAQSLALPPDSLDIRQAVNSGLNFRALEASLARYIMRGFRSSSAAPAGPNALPPPLLE